MWIMTFNNELLNTDILGSIYYVECDGSTVGSSPFEDFSYRIATGNRVSDIKAAIARGDAIWEAE